MLTRTARLYRSSFAGLSRDMWMLALINLINRAGAMVIPFMTVYLTQELQFTMAQAGYVMSCFGIGSIIGTYIGGRLTDSIGYYRTQFWTLFLTGFVFLLVQQVSSFPAMCAAIFFLSIIADAFRPASFASVAVYSRPENRTRSYSLLRLAINLGFSIGPALGGWIAHVAGFSWLFWLDGLTCIAAALTYLAVLKPKKEPVADSAPGEEIPKDTSPLHDRLFMIFILFATFMALAFMQLFSTLPVFFKEAFDFSEGRIGALLAVNGLIIALVEMPLVHLLESRQINRIHLVSFGVLLIGLAYILLLAFGFWSGIALCAIIVLTFGEIFAFPFSNVIALSRSTPNTRGRYMAMYGMSFSIALVLAPTLGLQTAQHWGFPTLLLGLSGLSLIALLGFFSLRHKLNA